MTPAELISHLRSLDVRVWLEGDRLRYSAPDGVMTPALRARLADEKPRLIAFLRQANLADDARHAPLPRAPRDGELPLSFSQQRLWFLDRLSPGNAAYNIFQAVRIGGALDVPTLKKTLDEIVRRHEVLRTAFPMVEGRPVQRIAPALDVDLPVVDLRGLSKDVREAEIARLARFEARRPFDLGHVPLLRTILLRVEDTEFVALFTMHHIVGDGWSVGVLVKELAALYQAFARGEPSPLPELPVQYADYASWQRQWVESEAFKRQLAYWREQLDGAPAVLDLPTDRPRPAIQTFVGRQEAFVLPEALSEALRAVSRKEGVTLFMTLFGAFAALLHRYAGQDDIVVGTAVANRHRPELEPLIGCFVNTLVLRTDLSGNPTLRELVRRVYDVAMQAFAHQDMPFDKLVSELRPERDLSHAPLFQVAFQLQNAFRAESGGHAGLTLRSLDVDSRTTKFDLGLSMSDAGSRLSGSVQYNTCLFEDSTIRRMIDHFQRILQALAENPAQRLSDVSLLSPVDEERLLITWNHTAADYPSDRCAHELFEAQAAKSPDAVAVAGEDGQVTYGALNHRANQLARHLKDLGVGPETMVGICLPRSPEMIVAILAVLKAGGAYVPLDPSYPRDRLALMIEQTRLAALLTQQSGVADLAELAGDKIPTVCLDRDWTEIGRHRGENLTSGAVPDNLAYVIYTSGSTGRPKGTLLHHRGLCNFVHAYMRSLAVGPGDSVLQFSSLSFDASIPEIFVPLAAGAKVCLVDQETRLSGFRLAQVLREQQVTLTTLTPSVLKVLSPEDLPALETVIAVAERCSDEIARRWKPGRRFLNGYGPTETTVGPTVYEVTDPAGETANIPIGSPIANMQVYLVDRHLRLVPAGLRGEVVVGGVGLARGYLERPELTAEKFVPNPFSRRPGARLYKTGDLAHYRPDGNLEFLGRIDNQVKIRGFRIEPGEIEAVAAGHERVECAAVVVRENENRLVAFYQPKQETKGHPAPSPEELRAYLSARLPDYMVPQAFVAMEALPRTPSGKLDRRALPIPDPPEASTAFVPPRTPEEAALVHIWEQILGVPQIGIHDNFFAIGGDSIRAIEMIDKASRAGLPLTPAQLFQHPTVAGLVEQVGTARPVEAEQGLVTGPVPLTPIQRWFFEQQFSEAHHWNWSFLREIPAGLNPALLRETVRRLVLHHDALRLRFYRTAAGWEAVNAGADENVPFAAIDLSALRPEDRRPALEAAAAALQGSLNLSEGPLLRVAHFLLGDGHADRVLLIFHHLVVDVVSMRILTDDMHTVLGQLRQGEPVRLPPKTTSFQTWARRLVEYAQSREVKEEADDWVDALQGAESFLPLDHPQGVNWEASADLVVAALEPQATAALVQDLPAAHDVGIAEALLAALARTFAEWTGRPALLIEMEGHGREGVLEGVDCTRTVGWFTSAYPVRLDLNGTADPIQAARAVREQLRRVPHRGVGYGLLKYLCQDPDIRQRIRRLPTAQVNFNYLGHLQQALPATAVTRRARERKGPERSPRALRSYPLYIAASIREGVLRVHWNFSTNLHRRLTIERLAERHLEELRGVIRAFQMPQ